MTLEQAARIIEVYETLQGEETHALVGLEDS
jgi:hypothetical protein